MDIGQKIKAARTDAELTQEEAAEALGVSRQTVSNWENAKTYPDIVSVIKMSEIYKISLDKLLKGEESSAGYIDYLEESTNTVKSNDRKVKIICLSVYLSAFLLGVLAFWLLAAPADAYGYSIMFFLVVLPVLTLFFSFIIGKNNLYGRLKWLFVPFFGVMFCLGEYATFSAANMAANSKFNAPSLTYLLIGAVLSVLGLALGHLIYSRMRA